MRKAMKNESGKRYSLGSAEDGLLVEGFSLYDRDGLRLGDATVTLDRVRRRLTLALVMAEPATGYACGWPNYTAQGYAGFLLGLSTEYIADRLAEGHGEAEIFRPDLTRMALAKDYDWASGDADWAGAALMDMDECECESDFYVWGGRFDIEDVYTYFRYGPGENIETLRDKLLPALRLALTKETEA